MKLHLACGTVYLKGWTNIDLEQPNFYLAKDRPDLVEKNGTDLDNYYKEERTTEDFMKGKFHKKEGVVDVYADVRKLSFNDGSISEMVGMHIFEHFDLIEAHELLSHWYMKLKIGGTLRLHVPDAEGILDEYVKGENLVWTIRQITGSQKNHFGVHKYQWTMDSLKEAFEKHGFSDIRILPNINQYSSFGIIGTK